MGNQRGSSTTGSEGQDNVVQLPRDWLGPREELVPFGPRAWAQDASADQPAEEEGAFAADDFWGENSESLHTAVRGPVATSAAEAAPGGLDPAAQGTPAPVVDAVARRSRPGFSLRVPVAAAAVVAATVAAVAVLVLIGGAGPGRAPAVNAASANSEALIGHLSSTGGTIDAGVRRLASLRLITVRRQHRPPAARPLPHTVSARVARAVGGSSGGGTAPSVPALPGPSYTPSSTASSANAPVTSAPSGASSDGAGAGAGASSSSSSPSNQPAFGANGTLGPGSSPNG